MKNPYSVNQNEEYTEVLSAPEKNPAWITITCISLLPAIYLIGQLLMNL